MKKILALVLAMTMVFSAAALAEGTLRVGMECDYAPFNWTQTEESETAVALPDGTWADGYDVQIAMKIAEGLGMELEVVKIAWEGLPMAVMSGKIDAIIAGMSATEERKVTLDFTDNYYESDLVIVVRADGAYTEAASLSDFAGARLTAQLGTFHYDVLPQVEGALIQTAMESFPTMITALEAGAIDGYVSERPGAVSAVASNPELTFVEFAEGQGFTASLDDTAVAVALQKGSPLVDKINEILATITPEQREELMQWAVDNQPLAE
ncbi:MAG: transporter substrate-binding domain-containing protein [Clostridia bacterium]|nr:transporter substrate-binding domain-containing protein [Clostridia bacterium]